MARRRRKQSLTMTILFVVILLAILYWQNRDRGRLPSHMQAVTVVQVRDGDTVELSDGRAVRLLGIDTPERGEPGADSATAMTKRMLLGKQVELEYGHERQDRYQRDLAWIFLDGRMANMELLKAGWAWCYFFEPNLKYSSQMVLAVRQAMQDDLGIWSMPNEETELSYIGSLNGFRFHRPNCTSGSKIKLQNQITFTARDSALFDGYAPCGRCSP